MRISVEEALRQVWAKEADASTALTLAIEVLALRERIEKMLRNEEEMIGIINRLYDNLEAVL